MWLRFQDEHGRRGKVTADFRMDYEGYWKDEVSECLTKLEQELHAEDETIEPDTIFREILLELPEQVPITRVERRGQSRSVDSDRPTR